MNSANLKPQQQALRKTLDELLLQTEDWKKLLAVIEKLQRQRDRAIQQVEHKHFHQLLNQIRDDDAELAAILESKGDL